jgi:hypothetical protein
MRSNDARWYLAVEALARMPELAHRLVEVHQADAKGYCRGCMAPGGTLFVRWPCGLHRLASAAIAPAPASSAEPSAASVPAHEPDPGHQPAFGAGRRSAFGPHRRRAPIPGPEAPPDAAAGSGG